MGVLGIGTLTLLVIAASLKPDPFGTGYGTHQQLGLPPCTMVQVFGIRCPSCGMTTSWAYTVRGQLLGAIQANCGGMLLCIGALAFTPWALVSSVRGRWWLGLPREQFWLWAGVTVLVVTLADWAYRLTCG